MHQLKPGAVGDSRRSKRQRVPATLTTATQPLQFLMLPAETRNLIYEYCLRPSGCTLKYQGTRRKYYRRGILSFTQVCRQVRTEFRPLYLSAISVRLSEVEPYVQRFLPLSQSLEQPITVIVNIQQHHRTDLTVILPFLRSLASRKMIKIRFQCNHPGGKLAQSLGRVLDR
ncbi:hypothetical protein T440DRAFT_44326 [Plenodomus tracheiphilus IPT5]|uniref:F-box domain-containing protein n=1 Tax=Plenodomus tracheiphilus IPT5 TaxID=1408161 RepID=A0A6A7AQ12_9PLEO|nr:hypothetical protein T440DRAFT_44326 [Plenodomus tracheiphilus IPT5]